MFAYEDFCLKILKAGATEFAIAIHGDSRELHDYLTNAKGSFQETLQGIKNLVKLNQRVMTNTVITKPNYRHLPNIARLLINTGVKRIQFAFIHIMGNVHKNKYSVVPRKTLVEPYVKKALDIGISAGVAISTEAIPYCFMVGYENCVGEEKIPRTKVFDLDYVIEDFTITRQREGKTKDSRCQKCLYFARCEGPLKEYPELFTWNEFRPIKK